MPSTGTYSAIDYYPFGMEMPKRTISATAYRFGYNGQMKDNEYTGQDGAHLNYEFREYDSRIGRWLSVDPLDYKGPIWSPYSMSKNNPILLVDKDGKWPGPIHAEIIREAFAPLVKAGKVTAKQVEFMIQGSINADAISNQTVEKSYIHSMRAPGQSQIDAEQKRSNFIGQNESTFAKLSDFSETEGDAWNALGSAMHPEMDEIAPSHAEKDQNGLVWFKVNDLGYDLQKWIIHGSAEKEISPEQKKAAIGKVLQVYYDAMEMKNNTSNSEKNEAKEKVISSKKEFEKKTDNAKTVIIGRCL